MKKFTLIILFILSLNAFAQLPLRAIMEANYSHDTFMLGSSSGYPQMTTESQVILDREYNYVTPTNEFKQTAIHPNPGNEYTWFKPDAFVESCRNNGQVIRMHSPISPQCSDYVQDDSRTAEELATIMTEYMTALCNRYNGVEHIIWMDVVNETIDKDGTWFGPKPGVDKWENPWTQMGFDNSVALAPPIYIDSAFAIANKLAPDIKQMINQHGDFEAVVWEKMKDLVAYLRAKGRRIDGIGWQAHIDLGWEKVPGNLTRLSNFIDWCHNNDLAFHITEFNVWLRDGNEGKLDEQADTFATLVKLLKDKSANGPTGVNFWQISCKDSQHSDRDGSIWDIDHNVKPAYYAIKAAINPCADEEDANNLLTNGSFELGIEQNWSKKFYGGAEGEISNSTQAYSCNNAAKIEVTTAKEIGNAGIETERVTAIEDSQHLVAEAWLKGDAGKTMRLQMMFELSDGSKRYFPSDTLVMDGTYMLLSDTFIVPENAVNFILRVQCGAAVGSYYVDEVKVWVDSANALSELHQRPFRLSPNPARHSVRVWGNIKKNTYAIYALQGTLLLEGKLQNKQADISSLSSGIYFFRLGQNETQRLMVY